jgi:hypothetical protein
LRTREELTLQIEIFEKLTSLVKDLRLYNKVFIPDFMRLLEETDVLLRKKLRSCSKKPAHVKEMRARNLKYQKELIPFIRDAGFQYRDEDRGGMVKIEGGKSVGEYIRILFNK